MKNIKISSIKKFSKNYNKDLSNKIIENMIINNGIIASCLDNKIILENQNIFNIELEETKRYDQKNSSRCWCYAGLNFLKHNVAKNMNIEIKDLELSANYLTFYDKLEKANTIYEQINNLENPTFENLNKLNLTSLDEGGHFEYFKELVKKYGLIPLGYMKESYDSEDSNEFNMIYEEKIKRDILILIKGKKKKENIEILIDKMLEEDYFILSKILGEPPQKILLEYKDKSNKIVKELITPMEFYEKYVSLNLDNYISVSSIKMKGKSYYKLYYHKYNESILNKSKPVFLNLPILKLKELAIKQLKDKVPVWVGVEIDKNINIDNGILDKKIYNYEKIFNFKRLNKLENMNLCEISSDHAMCIVGVHLDKGKPTRWKIENSWGNDNNNGYLIMNDNTFEDSIIEIAIDKKYLPKDDLKYLKQSPIPLKEIDPI